MSKSKINQLRELQNQMLGFTKLSMALKIERKRFRANVKGKQSKKRQKLVVSFPERLRTCFEIMKMFERLFEMMITFINVFVLLK